MGFLKLQGRHILAMALLIESLLQLGHNGLNLLATELFEAL